MGADYHGILSLHKPLGITSHDCVLRIRKLFKTKKVGHTGTLDPNASGVLPICIGNATKVAQYMSDYTKSYEAEITLGTATITEDAAGEVIAKKPVDSSITVERLKQVLETMKGSITQTPPIYSAVKVKGKKLYQYAREGLDVERPARRVTIEHIKLLSRHDVDKNNPSFRIHVTCSKGTYVRTLAVDIGKKLGYPAHVSSLIRTKSGPFTIDESVTFEQLEKDLKNATVKLYPIGTAVSHFDKIVVDEATAKKIKNGVFLPLTNQNKEKRWAVFRENGELIAIYIRHPSKPEWMKPEKVITTSHR